MSVKDHVTLFDNDFVDLFYESNMDVDEEGECRIPLDSIHTTINSLKSNVAINRRFKDLQTLASYVEEIPIIKLEKIILEHLMPASKIILVNIFNEILNVINTQEGNSDEAMHNIQEYLNMCIGIQEILNSILEYVLQNEVIDLCSVQSLPVVGVDILLLTFEHCKTSNHLYKNYFNDLQEIVQLFRKAQDVHGKLLKLFVSHLNFNFALEEHMTVLIDSLNSLCKIGEVLVDMNVKVLADTWRGYITIIQKFSKELVENSLDVSKAVTFLMSEIVRILGKVSITLHDEKNATQHLKICSFFVKILLKLYDMFWIRLEDQNNNHLMDFFVSVYDFHPINLKFRGVNECIVNDINLLIFCSLDTLTDKALNSHEFYQLLYNYDSQDMKLLLFLIFVFNKMPIMYSNTDITKVPVAELISKLLKIINSKYVEFFWKIPQSNKNYISLYDMTCSSISNVILLSSAIQYREIELILLKTVIQNEHMWSSLLATDIWYIVLRQKGSKLVYETLVNFIKLTNPIVQSNFSYSPETVLAQNLLRRFYNIIDEPYTSSLIEKYPPRLNLHIWKCFGFNTFPSSHFYLIESVLVDAIDKIDDLKGGKCNIQDFDYLCHAFDVILSLSDDSNGLDLKYFVLAISKLWDFDSDICNKLQGNILFGCFLKRLCYVTAKFGRQLNIEQLTTILSKLKRLLTGGFKLDLQALEIPCSLSKRSLEKHQTPAVLSEIFRLLMSNNNPIIKQRSLEVFANFINTSSHEEIARSTVKNSADLQELVTNFIQRKDYCGNALTHCVQKNCKFKHKCSDLPLKRRTIVPKRNEDVNVVLRRIKNDIDLFFQHYGQSGVSEKCFTAVSDILFSYVNRK